MGAFIGRFLPTSVTELVTDAIPDRESLDKVVDSLVSFEEQVVQGAQDSCVSSRQ